MSFYFLPTKRLSVIYHLDLIAEVLYFLVLEALEIWGPMIWAAILHDPWQSSSMSHLHSYLFLAVKWLPSLVLFLLRAVLKKGSFTWDTTPQACMPTFQCFYAIFFYQNSRSFTWKKTLWVQCELLPLTVDELKDLINSGNICYLISGLEVRWIVIMDCYPVDCHLDSSI